MSVELSEELEFEVEEDTVGLKLGKVRDYRSVKSEEASEASEEAHALSSTQKRKGEQGARKNRDQGSRLYFILHTKKLWT
jgi:hypothetical protein